MGSGTDLEHFDSTSTLFDNSTEISAFYFDLSWDMSQKFDVFLNGMYTLSKAAFSTINLPPPPEAPGNGDYDYTMVNTYSDLKYNQLQTTLGLDYDINEKTSIYGSVVYAEFQDEELYVFGDQSGTLVLSSLGLTVGF